MANGSYQMKANHIHTYYLLDCRGYVRCWDRISRVCKYVHMCTTTMCDALGMCVYIWVSSVSLMERHSSLCCTGTKSPSVGAVPVMIQVAMDQLELFDIL